MIYLGIDYGLKKAGFAISSGKLASPLKVIHFSSHLQLLQGILKIVEDEGVEKIVIGLSDGMTAQAAKSFSNMLEVETGLPIEFQDETLTTKDAQRLSIEAGINRKKRQRLEDAYAATLILQSYLDSQ